ncbi:MAG TPA: hypothetical protein PLG50_00665 [bacterium]|nr:hypothetical protein [bacterium]HQG44152.1 hypothetical protein [bacterium]HQI49843.1 hypothetical protein [bacterium]HQJ64882.1 hypothetical protein [bacterium]
MKVWIKAGLLALPLLAASPRPLLADKNDQARAKEADVVAPDAVVRAAYECISGPRGRDRDWDRMRNLWIGNARIILSSADYEGKSRWENLTLESFIQRVSDYYKAQGFFEREIASTIQRFGNVAQIWSTFEIRKGSSTGPVISRGINSWQLVRHEERWWIAQLVYDFESSRNPLPERYLK